MTLTQRRCYTRAALALAAALLTSSSPSKASMTLQLYDSKVVFRNDGLNTVGVHVNECQDSSQMLWIDDSVKKPFAANTDGYEYSYPLDEGGFSPAIKKAMSKLKTWIKLSTAEKVKAADPSSRAALKEALAEKCVIKQTSQPVRQPEPQLDANGCPPGKKYYERREGTTFFGIKLGEGKLTWSGCLTDGEAAAAGAGTTTYSQPVAPIQNYQYPRPIRCVTQYGVTSCY